MLFRIYLTTQLLCCTSSKKFLLLFLYIRTFLVDFPENIECSLRAPAESLDGGTKEIYQLSTDGNGGGLFDDSFPANELVGIEIEIYGLSIGNQILDTISSLPRIATRLETVAVVC
jgi:hypothetical protein